MVCSLSWCHEGYCQEIPYDWYQDWFPWWSDNGLDCWWTGDVMAAVRRLLSIYAFKRLHFAVLHNDTITGGNKDLYSSLVSKTDLGELEKDWLVTELTGSGLLEWLE